jgi:hypothetical protein
MATSDFITQYKEVNKGLSYLGALQGYTGAAVGIPYSPSGFINALFESVAGTHDELNSFHYYDIYGNNITGASSGLNGIWNLIDLFPAAPIGLGTLNNAIPGFVTNIINTNQSIKENSDNDK